MGKGVYLLQWKSTYIWDVGLILM